MPTALLVHAHPDDEVFATGAASIALADAGWRVVLRVATGGEAGEGRELPEDVARQRRLRRLDASSALLGIAEWDWLCGPARWIDGGSPDLGGADVAEVASGVVDALAAVRPDLVLSVGRDGLTGHPDHITVAAAIPMALRLRPDLHCRALGACVRARDVEAAHARLAAALPGAAIGSGRVRGSGEAAVLHEIAAAPTAEQRRREALDAYHSGLGTAALDQLSGRGDSELLRAVFDVAGWTTDRFESLG